MKRLSPSTHYLLKAFLPFSEANLRLSFKPQSFFAELNKKSKLKERTLRSAYYRAIKAGLLVIDDAGVPRLTPKGKQKIKPYKPKHLGKGSYLLISFDIPEGERYKRNHLRLLLRELSCTKIQQSLWASRYDHRDYLAAEIKEHELENNVIVYEAVKLDLS